MKEGEKGKYITSYGKKYDYKKEGGKYEGGGKYIISHMGSRVMICPICYSVNITVFLFLQLNIDAVNWDSKWGEFLHFLRYKVLFFFSICLVYLIYEFIISVRLV